MTTQLATRVDHEIKKTVEKVCRQRGLTIRGFVEDALLAKLEEMEDIEDVQRLRREPTRPLSAVIRDLKKHGKL